MSKTFMGGLEDSMTRIGRRSVLLGSLGVAAAMCGQGVFAATKRPRLSQRLGIQLYMIGQEMKSDVPGTLATLRKIGYRTIEGNPPAGTTATTFRAELDKAGLSCPSIHVSIDAGLPGSLALADTDAVIAQARALGAANAVVTFIPIMKLLRSPDARKLADPAGAGPVLAELARSMTVEEWEDLARKLNEAGAQLGPAGIRVGYHNHNVEFVKLPNGRPALELILERTDPKLVDFELDIGWLRSAGLDPVDFLKKHGARVSQLHLKDLKETEPNTALKLNTATVGRGVQNWNAILDVIPSTAVRNVYVETEPPYETSGLRSAAEAYAFLQPLMVRKGL
jgi:sugar phosphate isomerase/epimerase